MILLEREGFESTKEDIGEVQRFDAGSCVCGGDSLAGFKTRWLTCQTREKKWDFYREGSTYNDFNTDLRNSILKFYPTLPLLAKDILITNTRDRKN